MAKSSEREDDLAADPGDLQLGEHPAEMLDGAGAAVDAVADEAAALSFHSPYRRSIAFFSAAGRSRRRRLGAIVAWRHLPLERWLDALAGGGGAGRWPRPHPTTRPTSPWSPPRRRSSTWSGIRHRRASASRAARPPERRSGPVRWGGEPGSVAAEWAQGRQLQPEERRPGHQEGRD